MIACNCLGVGVETLREHLAKAAKPVKPRDMHDQFGYNPEDCCGECRHSKGNRLFVAIVNEHNASFEMP